MLTRSFRLRLVDREPAASLTTWNETDEPCQPYRDSQWDGVYCDAGGRVFALWLGNYSLRGDLTVLAESLASLDRLLESLVMNDNFLTGEIPGSSVSRWARLDLSNNALIMSGNINLESLSVSLESPQLRNNTLTGGISGLLRFPNMTYLDLSANALDGSIPGGLEVKLRRGS